MNKEFEKLPDIAESIKDGGIYFNVKEDCYIATDVEFYYDAGYANGALYAYQEQQKKIDSALNLINSENLGHDARLGDFYRDLEDILK